LVRGEQVKSFLVGQHSLESLEKKMRLAKKKFFYNVDTLQFSHRDPPFYSDVATQFSCSVGIIRSFIKDEKFYKKESCVLAL